MKKAAIQIVAFLAVFYASWFALSQVDWMTLFRVNKITKTTEQKLGDLFWDMYHKSEKEITTREITDPLDSLLSKICTSNDIDKSKISLHVVKNDEINAFALPNRHLVIYTGLIKASENEAEISGVICHELAHMELDHVMKKLVKEVGLSMLISISTGNSGSETIKQTIKMLSSSAYDRNLEKEADIKAVDYLLKSQLSPESFANFMFRLASESSKLESNLSWISTHPESKERAEYIIEYMKGKPAKFNPLLSVTTWDKLQQALKQD